MFVIYVGGRPPRFEAPNIALQKDGIVHAFTPGDNSSALMLFQALVLALPGAKVDVTHPDYKLWVDDTLRAIAGMVKVSGAAMPSPRPGVRSLASEVAKLKGQSV